MRRGWLAVGVCAIGLSSAGAKPAAKVTPITKLADAPPNTWVRITGPETGIRRGAALFWSEAIGKFVLAQGVSGDTKRGIPRPYDVQVFDPKTAVWENHFPPGKEGVWGQTTGAATVPRYKESVNYFQLKDKEGNLRPTARLGLPNGFAVDADGSGFYIYARGYSRLIGVKPGATWRYDVKARRWGEVGPSHRIDVPAHGGPPKVIGARLVHEPVNGELLLLGGQAPNVINGSVGNWAFSIESKAWTRLQGTDRAVGRPAESVLVEPPPRANPAVAFDPARKVVVLFGGDHFDYAMSDTWIYDPAKRSWRQVFPKIVPPPRWGASLVWLPKSRKLALVGGTTVEPRFQYFIPADPSMADVWLFDVKTETWGLAVRQPGPLGLTCPTLPCAAAAGPDDVIIGLSSPGGWPVRYEGGTWALRVDAEKVDEEGTKELGAPPGSRTSRAITRSRSNPKHRVYDPSSYDAAEPGDPKAVEAWFANLKPNTWTEVPPAPRHVPQSEWGTAVYDPHRDQIHYWTGGHMSDPANAVHTYHPAVNRWSIPYVAEIPIAKGLTFNNRPDCKNHTYHNYAYDPVSKQVVAATYAGTGVYDPDAGDWTMTLARPYRASHYTMNLFTTPKGVMVWAEGFFGTFDVEAMTYTKWPITGGFNRYLGPDANGAVWDPERKVMWLLGRTGWRDTDGQVFAYNLDTREMKAMNPVNADTVGQKAFYLREAVYVPSADLVLTLSFTARSKAGRQVAYDPTTNRWVALNVTATGRVGSPMAMVSDTKRNLVWCLAGSRLTYVLRIDPKTLEMSDTLAPSAKTE